ncbi:hypothetical protein M3D00_14685 [Dietzia cinnamea]|uniref:hypothetical protein n=1 Tax=Dietzia TaxID=37914 RepID=UPI0015F7B264|nr:MULTISPECIES: hypothetical protein [Dietzia]MBB1030676.1 hypothetical protein [Dietzia sp. SLG310A2-38A2]MCT2031385.1 hypothetical protein [Dietzia cinnamea]
MSRRKPRPWIPTGPYVPLLCTGKGSHRSYYFGSYFTLTGGRVEWWLSPTPRLRLKKNGYTVDAHRMTFPRDNYDPFTGGSRGYRIEEHCGDCGRDFQRLDDKFYDEVKKILTSGVTVLDISWLER